MIHSCRFWLWVVSAGHTHRVSRGTLSSRRYWYSPAWASRLVMKHSAPSALGFVLFFCSLDGQVWLPGRSTRSLLNGTAGESPSPIPRSQAVGPVLRVTEPIRL